MLRFKLAPCLCLLIVGLVGGCNQPTTEGHRVAVSGNLVEDGQPAQVSMEGNLPPGETVGRMSVTFYAIESEADKLLDADGNSLGKQSYSANVSSDATFSVPGHEGKGLPPGLYRVVVTHIDPRTEKDRLANRFNEANSTLIREIPETADEVAFEIDVSKP